MRRLVTLTAIVAFVGAFTLAFAAVPRVAQAAHLSCGDTLLAPTSLDADLTCTGTALFIGRSGITVDLNGFTITGDVGDGAGVNTEGFNAVTIQNGTIDKFEFAVLANGSHRLVLSHLHITGERGGPNAHAVDIRNFNNVVIEHSSFVIPDTSVDFAEAIRLQSGKAVVVENVDVHGGFIGVNFACDLCNGTEPPTNGKVQFSTFTENVIGVLIANSTNALVRENHVSDGVFLDLFGGIDAKGISVDSDFGAGNSVTGVVVKNNHVHDSEGIGIRVKAVAATTTSDITVDGNLVHDNDLDGILLVDTDDSEITENLVNDNGGDGIALTVGSTGNDITDNGATGNTGDDMFHDGGSTGNTWAANTCGTSSGAEVVGDCP